ncbi:hypothetical protein HAX54_022808, partial [Datura stramonium]|nr:hypothetical protein [Datura stramonium]
KLVPRPACHRWFAESHWRFAALILFAMYFLLSSLLLGRRSTSGSRIESVIRRLPTAYMPELQVLCPPSATHRQSTDSFRWFSNVSSDFQSKPRPSVLCLPSLAFRASGPAARQSRAIPFFM